MAPMKLLTGNKKWYHQSQFICILLTVLNDSLKHIEHL